MASSDDKEVTIPISEHCFGEAFRVNDRGYWHCPKSGKITEVDLPLPNKSQCPMCRRPIILKYAEVEVRTKTIQQICFKDGRQWHDLVCLISYG